MSLLKGSLKLCQPPLCDVILETGSHSNPQVFIAASPTVDRMQGRIALAPMSSDALLSPVYNIALSPPFHQPHHN